MSQPPATILISSADERTRRFLVDTLTADGYALLAADSDAAALALMGSKFPDLAILDLERPDHAGLEIVTQVRRSDRLVSPVDPELLLVALSGRAAELDRLRAFDRGVDDFLAKPFSYKELRARVDGLLRRSRRLPAAGRLRIGALVVDPGSRQAWLRDDSLSLSNKEFSLLRALAAEPTRVFTREELLRGVWGFRSMGETRTLDSHAARLRHKLCAHGDRFVVNVWGVGYRLIDGALDEVAA